MRFYMERVEASRNFANKVWNASRFIMMNLEKVIGRSYKGQVIDGSTRFAELLLNEKRVAVVPALAFGNDNFARLSYATSRSNIVEGCKRIACFISELD